MSRTKTCLLVLSLLLVGHEAWAQAPKTLRFLVCQPGGPKLEKDEQTVIRDFYNYVGKSLGYGGRTEGEYLTRHDKCVEAMKSKPAVVMLSLDLFLAHRKSLGLNPVAQINLDGNTTSHYYVMAGADGPSSMDALRGKLITGTVLDDAKFVARVLLDGKLGPAGELKLKSEKLGLRAVRKVVRGKAAAVLLDAKQYAAIADTPFAKKLKLLYKSPPVPNPPIAVMSARVDKKLEKKIGDSLLNMSNDTKGQKLIKTFGIHGFDAPKKNAWTALETKLAD